MHQVAISLKKARHSPKTQACQAEDENIMNQDGLRVISTISRAGAKAAIAAAIATLAGQALAAPPDALVAAAKKEGQLTVIALPHDWCGYGD